MVFVFVQVVLGGERRAALVTHIVTEQTCRCCHAMAPRHPISAIADLVPENYARVRIEGMSSPDMNSNSTPPASSPSGALGQPFLVVQVAVSVRVFVEGRFASGRAEVEGRPVVLRHQLRLLLVDSHLAYRVYCHTILQLHCNDPRMKALRVSMP